MESKCFTKCIRKPGHQMDKSEEVTIYKIIIKTKLLFILDLFGKVYG